MAPFLGPDPWDQWAQVLSYGHRLPVGSFGLAEVDRVAALAFCAGEAGSLFRFAGQTYGCWGYLRYEYIDMMVIYTIIYYYVIIYWTIF